MAPHIVFLSISLPFTIPMAQLAKALVQQRGFTATLITLADNSKNHAEAPFLETLIGTGISLQTIPPLSYDHIPADVTYENRLTMVADLCAPYVATILHNLTQTNKPVAFIVDPVAVISTVDITRQLNLPCYFFFSTNATAFAYCFHLPEIDEQVNGEYHHLTEPLSLPGCVQVEGTDFLVGSQQRDSGAHRAYLRIFNKYREADGVLLNSFVEMEPETYRALREKEIRGEMPPVYPVGPMVTRDGWGDADDECLKWLDAQPENSVLYISFGAGGTLTPEQKTELAYGLEQSGQRFLWVIRPTTENYTAGTFFDLKAGDVDPRSCLPEGFLERTKDRGFVVTHWAPQVHVLKHVATGGFVTHCGWSSVLEGIHFGVPMVAWPLHGEQRINAVLMSDGKGDLGVALRAKSGADGVVRREEAARVVKELMAGVEGEKVRENVLKVREAGVKALEKGGSSYEALSKLCDKISA